MARRALGFADAVCVGPPAIGAYARDAVGATILSTDLRVANGVDHPAVPDVTLARPSRLSIERVQLVSAGLGTAVTVTLALDGRTLDGEAEGAATQTGLLRSVAAATLRAVEQITDGTVRFEVEHVEIARAGTDQTALVVITMLTGRSTERLSGASVVREDTREAVIRAVLAALNRRMEPLAGRPVTPAERGCWNAREPGSAEAKVTTEPDVRVGVRPPWTGSLEPAGAEVLHVRRAPGTSDAAEPAVFVHGLGGSATNWTDVMGLLQDRLSGAAPDLPGFGWSPPPSGDDYSLTAHARVITDFIESDAASTGHGPVHLIGNSLGGTVATLVAARRPDLVRSLTLVSPAMPVLRPRSTNAHLPALAAPWIGQRLARRLGRFPVEARVKATLALCFADPSRVSRQRFEEAIAEADRRARLGHESDAMLLSLRSLIAPTSTGAG